MPSSDGRLARVSAAPLWAHALAYALVLVAALPLLRPDSSFSNDEGAYATQAASLRDGHWAYRYEATPADPEATYFPIILSVRKDGSSDFLTYGHHPAYARGLAVSTRAAGQTAGLHLPALLGAWLTAVAAWLLARELAPGTERWAFWIAATGPVLVNAYVIWAHAPSAAVAALTLLAAVRTARLGPSALRLVAVAAGVAAGVLMRSEALFVAAVAAVVIAFGSGLRLRRQALLGALVPVVAGIGARVAEQAWRNRLTGGSYEEPARTKELPFIEGRLRGAWHDLLSGVYTKERAGDVLVVALVLVVVAALLARRRGRAAPVLLAVASLLLVVRIAMAPRDPITGLLAAWPVVVLGVLLVSWRELSIPARALLAGVGLFAVAVLANNYPYGGGLEWGGRFFAPVLAPLAVLAAIGLVRAAPVIGRWATVLTVLTAAAGLIICGGVRGLHDGQITATERHLRAWTVTDFSPLPRLAWRLDDDTAWLLADANPIDGALDVVRRMGGQQITVVQREEKPVGPLERFGTVQEHKEPDLNKIGYRVFTLERQ